MAIQQTRRAPAPARVEDTQRDQSARGRDQMDRRYLRQREQRWQQKAKDSGEERIATGLGWFSIGLGLAEVLAPRGLARLIGLRKDHPILLRVMGVREILSGVGILTERRPAGWVWSRVAGDAMDLSLLGVALASSDNDRGRVALVTASVLGVTALDMYDAQKLSAKPGMHGGLAYAQAITIRRPAEELYRYWRDFGKLPQFMEHLESVQVLDERRSHWVAKAPAGTSVEWDAEITEDRPNELISWRSVEGSDVENFGSVRFVRAPGDRGTEVWVEVEYNPPAGALGAAIAKLFGEAPEQQIKGDLFRFKQVMETGEVVKSDSSIHRGPHPAQPPE
ncbi:MAG TPA: SRPBCC family protein, partial [Blastocatellia bacterium]|nr:SRPBCC family protein [Blastocatellia bacterium]